MTHDQRTTLGAMLVGVAVIGAFLYAKSREGRGQEVVQRADAPKPTLTRTDPAQLMTQIGVGRAQLHQLLLLGMGNANVDQHEFAGLGMADVTGEIMISARD